MDKITEILKEMHEMADEPVGMAIGGGVIGPGVAGDGSPLGVQPLPGPPNDSMRIGNLLTPEEYQQRFIDYYSFPGIGVEAAPPADS